jgi:hypothetical protein
MIKTLSAQECNWTTTEKECWAIVYDFDIQHIPGRLNIIADAFSRLKDIPEDLVHWMDDNDAQVKVDAASVARGLAKLLDIELETVLWMDEYFIPE